MGAFNFLWATWAKITGSNWKATPADVIQGQMHELRPLPMGLQAFEDWSDRIIAGALLPMDPGADKERFVGSQKYVLSNLILHLGPTEDHKEDAYFIHALRKLAANQVADVWRRKEYDSKIARQAAEDAVKKAADVPTNPTEAEQAARLGAHIDLTGTKMPTS